MAQPKGIPIAGLHSSIRTPRFFGKSGSMGQEFHGQPSQQMMKLSAQGVRESCSCSNMSTERNSVFIEPVEAGPEGGMASVLNGTLQHEDQ